MSKTRDFFLLPPVKITVSALCGIVILLITWVYLNSYYTLGVEDSLFDHETLIKHTFLKIKPEKTKPFVFISTGKDLSLVDDTAGIGNLVVSDRYKLFKLMQALNQSKNKPEFVLLDLQFYYPFNYTVNDSIQNIIKENHLVGFLADKSIDDSLQAEIQKNHNSAVSVLLDNNKIDTPIYKKINYGIADYITYGGSINKFRIYYHDLHSISIAALMHEKMDGAVYSGGKYGTICNHRLCFNTIWPSYYYNPESIRSDSTFQQYHIGELLSLPNAAQTIQSICAGKVVVIGNFEDDVHSTSTGELPGTIILIDIYLSLLNGTQYVSWVWLGFLLLTFSVMSYTAIYGKLPKINLKLSIFTNMLYSYFSKYFSYLGVLLLLSLISVLIFGVNISLFLPAFIFSSIDFIRQKKYRPKEL
jgi:hypothetical protein